MRDHAGRCLAVGRQEIVMPSVYAAEALAILEGCLLAQHHGISQAGISLERVLDSSTQLPEELVLWLVVDLLLVEKLQEEDRVSSEMCLCGALGVGIEARSQN
ncbi:hypothetical protein ACFX13_041942 [Malus domestica]